MLAADAVRDPKARIVSLLRTPEALLLAVALAAYAHTLGYPFVWDDEGLITRNPNIRSLADLFRLFGQDLYWGKGGNSYYRPLQAASYAFDHALYGLRPWGYHLTNILWHALTGIVFYRLFAALTSRKTLSLLAAGLWLVHPIQPEAVTYVAGRADSLCAFFIGLGMLLHLSAPRLGTAKARLRLRAGAGAAFGLALLSRESAFIFIPMLLSAELLFFPPAKKEIVERGIPYAGYLALLSLYAVTRAAVLPEFFVPVAEAGAMAHPLGLLAYPLALADGLGIVLKPLPLHMERLASGLGPDGTPKALAAAVAGATAAYWLWKRRDRALGWAFVFYVTSLLAVVPSLFLDRLFLVHWLYLPAFGAIFGVLVAADRVLNRAIAAGKARRDLAIVLAGAAAAASLLGMFAHNRLWGDPIVLYRHILEYAPWSRRTHYNLGLAYYGEGLLAEAEAEYEAAKSIFTSRELEGSIALLRLAQGRSRESLEIYDRIIGERSPSPFYLNNRASAYFALGKKKEARRDIEAAIAMDPDYRDAWFNLGTWNREAGQMEEAAKAFEQAARIGLDGQVAVELAKIYASREEAAKAVDVLLRALGADRSFPELYNMLGVLHAQQQNYRRAEFYWRQGLGRFPGYPAIKINLERLEALRRGVPPG